MNILVCSDIFGSTAHLKHLLDQVTVSADQIHFIDPYDSISKSFSNEDEAYEYFTAKGGISSYIEKVAFAVNQKKDDFIVLGFSAGGAAAWKALSDKQNQACIELIAFYPGQIRHYLELQPKQKTRLIFPSKEAHFNVAKVHQAVSAYVLVSSDISNYEHGFMNPISSGFNQQAYDKYVASLQDWLSKYGMIR